MTNSALNCIIIDDSPTQRLSISKMIDRHPNLNLVETYPNGIVAQQDLISNKVHLVFLDIEMPISSGFDFLEELENMKGLKHKPQVILIASKADYALKAFDYTITDYLQKPINKQRFFVAIDRVLKLKNQIAGASQEQPYILVNSNLQKVKVFLNEIKWVEALGDYIKIITSDKSLLVLSTMKDFLTKLPDNQFVRIHKSYIVNVVKIENFCSNSVEICNNKIPMSRSKKNELENILEHH
ncbi:LytTR family DNA-binding domain-containing protein [uncultured Maribacter sp.]|uniref:LytR/AlgR family response regulator transcription factor n=1 Tax=uncultured Maribacter sp. TaxID=431308 RepID=UPI002618EABB|nr:LytTR family DNA-binding domain-containing protein [uncultured Maribacter sp.]